MKNLIQTLSKAVIMLLVMLVPLVTMAQAKEETKKEAGKTETAKTSKCEKAPSHSYWAVTAYGALDQFNGDLSKNIFLNDKWMFGAGGSVTKQFSRVIGLRFRGGWVPLSADAEDKWVYEQNTDPKRVSENFTSWVIEAGFEGTVNWVNWIMGYKPERFFSSYLIFGVGADHTQGAKYSNDNELSQIFDHLLDGSQVEIFLVQKGHSPGFQAQAVEFPVGIGADHDDARGGGGRMDAAGAADAVLVAAQHHHHEGQIQADLRTQVQGGRNVPGFVDHRRGADLADGAVQVLAEARVIVHHQDARFALPNLHGLLGRGGWAAAVGE